MKCAHCQRTAAQGGGVYACKGRQIICRDCYGKVADMDPTSPFWLERFPEACAAGKEALKRAYTEYLKNDGHRDEFVIDLTAEEIAKLERALSSRVGAVATTRSLIDAAPQLLAMARRVAEADEHRHEAWRSNTELNQRLAKIERQLAGMITALIDAGEWHPHDTLVQVVSRLLAERAELKNKEQQDPEALERLAAAIESCWGKWGRNLEAPDLALMITRELKVTGGN